MAMGQGILFDAGIAGVKTIAVVKSYKHVGSISRPGGDLRSEVKKRTAEADVVAREMAGG